jgi:hypothetical protein
MRFEFALSATIRPMPRILPSEAARVMELLFPFVSNQEQSESTTLDFAHVQKISAAVSLLDRLPGELLTLSADEYANYVLNIELMRAWLPILQGGSNRVLHEAILRSVYVAVRKCPDQFPAPTVHAWHSSLTPHCVLRSGSTSTMLNAAC